MPTDIIQWFPGHMAKALREMRERLPQIDLIIELLDARIPYSSQNPSLRQIAEGKPLLTLLTKASLADPEMNRVWVRHFEEDGGHCLLIDCVTGEGMKQIAPAVRAALADKIKKYEEKGMSGRALRLMVVGIPNVGKSSFINRMTGTKKAKVENRPGVTKEQQWVRTPEGFDLLDTPGTLWHRFNERRVGENLGITGAIDKDVLQNEELAAVLISRLRARYPALLCTRYKLGEVSVLEGKTDAEVFEMIARRRGMLLSGNEPDFTRAANMLLDELRSAKIGRITLESPPKKREETANG